VLNHNIFREGDVRRETCLVILQHIIHNQFSDRQSQGTKDLRIS
jgi:hypothetical protein